MNSMVNNLVGTFMSSLFADSNLYRHTTKSYIVQISAVKDRWKRSKEHEKFISRK